MLESLHVGRANFQTCQLSNLLTFKLATGAIRFSSNISPLNATQAQTTRGAAGRPK
jgi:hypothetical protein